MSCRNCLGGGWVCENHRDHAWDGTADVVPCCGGAGAPCPVCQPVMACAPYTHRLHEALTKLLGDEGDPNIGWHGHTPSHPAMFACEFCRAESNDVLQIAHKETCPIPAARATTKENSDG